jgi:glutamate-ammonia-ligase adenylyltransferase
MNGAEALGQLADEDARELLAPAEFRDWRAARRCLLRMAGDSAAARELAALLPQLLPRLSEAASPDDVLVELERLAGCVTDRGELFRDLRDHPRTAEILVTLFAGSRFLTEILLRQPDAFSLLATPSRLASRKSPEQYLSDARSAVTRSGPAEAGLDALRSFQRRELLRIGAADLLGLFDLTTVTAELSNLADGLVRACLEIAARETETGGRDFAVIALGKLGGRELNYSSDIDLFFVAESNAPEYWRLGERLIENLARATDEGFLYRVDMRLRPWGESGPLVSSADAFLRYVERDARPWEKQALLKARVVAGDEEVGTACLRRVEPLLFGGSAEATRRGVHALKQLTEKALRERGFEQREVKLGEGSIRDVEFVVQYLQLAHGGEKPFVRSRNTLEALPRLMAAGVLAPEDAHVLREGYVFLRTIEHHLQVMDGRQTHLLPRGAEALGELARRLGFEGETAGERFRARHREHRTAIREIYMRHLGSEKMATPVKTPESPPGPRFRDHAERMDPSYTATFSEEEIRRHVVLTEQLDDEHLVAVEAVLLPDGLQRVTVVGYDYPGELSLICGLLFAGGFSIHRGEAFTYEPLERPAPGRRPPRVRLAGEEAAWSGPPRRRPSVPPGGGDGRRKTVDVFVVSPLRERTGTSDWESFTKDLDSLLRLLRSGKQREARGEIARRAALTQQAMAGAATPLYPVEIEIDNEISAKYTVLRIDAPDTAGFLYELTNAFALHGIYVARMTAGSAGSRVRDAFWVTDAAGAKISSPARQRELRVATVLIKHFTHLIPRSPNPESALLHFGEFLGQLFSRPDWPDELASLESPKVLDTLAQLLGVSDFLWDDFLRLQHANLLPVVRSTELPAKSRQELQGALDGVLATAGGGPEGRPDPGAWRAALNAFKDRELFRIDMRQILGQTPDFPKFAEELTDLAEIVVEAATALCLEELVGTYGPAKRADGAPGRLAVCALGKCGGRELGFASDIELMFVYAGEGETEGPQRAPAAVFYEKLVQAFVGAIRAKREGVFEIDLRLRPWGEAGSMAVSLETFRRYFVRSGPAWPYERQALIRLRPVAGDAGLGREVVRVRDELVYDGGPLDVTAMRAMRERQIRHLVRGGTFNPKFSPGGLVDVEYLVQGLQLRHGHRDERLRSPNTREAMVALSAAGILSDADHELLRKAQTFLRWLIEALRVVRGNAKDLTIPPSDGEEFAYLARRLRYGSDLARLREEILRYSRGVQETSRRLLEESP